MWANVSNYDMPVKPSHKYPERMEKSGSRSALDFGTWPKGKKGIVESLITLVTAELVD